MKKIVYLNIVFVFILFFAVSCKKDPVINHNGATDNFSQIFIQFWDKMNYQYVYWDKESTDWNLVYKKYKPLFDQLGNSDEDKRKAATYFQQMTSGLTDNHFSISFNDGVLSNLTVNPAYDRKIRSENFHSRFNYVEVVKTYLDPGFLSGKGNITKNGLPINVTSGTLNNNLLYFHCNFFALKKSYDSNNTQVKMVLDYFFSQLKQSTNPIKGVILDLRSNSGGEIIDLNFFAGKLVNKDITFGYTRGKSGLGKLSYLPWLESRLKRDPAYETTVPVVLLADNFSASLAEIMTLALKSPKNLVIGEQTYGATGAISDAAIFNSGSFELGNFASVTTSAVEFKGIDGTFYENVGITPDLYVPFNLQELARNKDLQLELAIRQFK